MSRSETSGSCLRTATTSVVAVLGGAAILGGILVAGGRGSQELIAVSEHLSHAARYDGFEGISVPAFLEREGVASSKLNLGACAIRPVTMHYETRADTSVDITSYTLEASAYNQGAYSKHLDKYISDAGELDITFQNSADLQEMIGQDPCEVLEPVLVTRNLTTS